MRFIKTIFLIIIAIFASHSVAVAAEKTESNTEKHQGFNPQKLIFHHINDAYEWHITTIGENHISIPLPVLVYSNQTGFHAFIASAFHHGTESYEGLKIAQEGKYEGKIVEIQPDGKEIRPLDFSITKNVASLFISIALILFVFLSASKRYKENFARAPKGIQSWVEPIIIFVRDDIAKAAIPDKYMKYLPYLLTIFFFIFFNNLLGLIPIFPGGANLTGNIAVTMVLALFTFFITQFSSSKDYWKHIVNMPGVPWWLKIPVPLMPVIETMGLFIKPFVLMIRLFANITAGHIVALAFYCLIFVFGEKNVFAGYGVSVVSVLFTVFMSLIELLVAFIQAYVFTLLSAMYFGMAMETHGEHHE